MKSLPKTHTLKRNTVTVAYNGTQGTDFFFLAKNVPFIMGTSSILGVPDLRDCKPFPLKIGLRYVVFRLRQVQPYTYFLNEKLTR